MKGVFGVLLLLTTLLGSAPDPCNPGGLKLADWSHLAEIKVEAVPEKGVTEFILTPQVFDLARKDLHDLRVVAEQSEDIGYVVKTSKPHGYQTPLSIRLYNRSHVPRELSSLTADFGHKTMKNRIQVLTKGDNFRRKVKIEGSDDELSWKTIRDGAFLFRIPGRDGKERSYDRNEIGFSDNNHRHLRITVFNAGDDPAMVEIEDVKAWQHVRTPPETFPVTVADTKIEQKKRLTEITLDLQYKNMPLHELQLEFTGDNFFRRVSVSGRDTREHVVRKPVEDSAALEKRVETPWKRISEGSVWRFASGSNREESSTISIAGAKHRYLLVRIFNHDDPPLGFASATVTRLSTHVQFSPRKKGKYELYFGNSKADKPVYDIENYISKLRADGVQRTSLGEAHPNPDYGPDIKEIPWSERHKGIIWIALLGMVAAMAVLVYRLAVSSGKPAT